MSAAACSWGARLAAADERPMPRVLHGKLPRPCSGVGLGFGARWHGACVNTGFVALR